MKLSTLVRRAALIAVFSNTGYAMQPPPPPLDILQLRGLIGTADLVAVGKVKELKETEEAVAAGREVRIGAVLTVERILKGEYREADLLIEESYTAPGSARHQCTPAPGEKYGKMIVGESAGPAQYHGVYRNGSRIIALLEPVKGGKVYRPLGSGTYDKHLGEFLLEDGAVRAVNFSFAADVERYARSENEFMDLVATLSKKREGL